MQSTLPVGQLCPHYKQGEVKSTSGDSLAGKTIMVVGGKPRPHAVRRTKRELGLKRVAWVPTRERQPSGDVYAAKAYKVRPDLVILLIGLMRHQQVTDLRNFCREQRMPCMTLHRSLSAAQLANAWVSQRYSS